MKEKKQEMGMRTPAFALHNRLIKNLYPIGRKCAEKGFYSVEDFLLWADEWEVVRRMFL